MTKKEIKIALVFVAMVLIGGIFLTGCTASVDMGKPHQMENHHENCPMHK